MARDGAYCHAARGEGRLWGQRCRSVRFRARVRVRVRSVKGGTRLHWPLVMLKDSWPSTAEGIGGGYRVRVRVRVMANTNTMAKIKVTVTIPNYPTLVFNLIRFSFGTRIALQQRQRLTEDPA